MQVKIGSASTLVFNTKKDSLPPLNEDFILSQPSNADIELDSIIDIQVLKNWQKALGKDTFKYLAKVSNIYFQEAPELLKKIATALIEGNTIELHEAADRLKSSSAALGARTLSKLSKELESADYDSLRLNASERVSQLYAEYEKFKVALQIARQQFRH